MKDVPPLPAGLPSKEELIAEYRRLRAERPQDRWVLYIKELRVTHGVSLFEAQKLALSDPTWRRWVERQINSDRKCRKEALAHIRCNGEASLIERIGDSFEFRIRADI
jgi:hypothetical protein